MKKRLNQLWFILGLGSQLQVIASLSITEAIVLAFAPYLYLRHYRELKRDGLSVFLGLAACVFMGCIVACICNHTRFLFAIRGLSVTAIIPCSIIFGHWLIRRCPDGFKWFLVGGFFSAVLCTFVFQRSVEVAMYGHGETNVDAIMSGPLYWIERLGSAVTLPTKGWFLRTPIMLDVPALLFMSVFALLTSSSGRSAALGALGGVAILLIGGKRQRSMRRFSRYFGIIILCALGSVFALNRGYRFAALNGWMGEGARLKYESQSKGSKSILKLLLGGRGEAFVGLLACRDKPIIGWGPWAEDTHGYWAEFISKYGTEEDVENMQRIIAYEARIGGGGFRLIQGHSHITMFWLWYGIFGLVFWLYVIFVLIRYLKSDAWVVPHWFAWIACAIPATLWHICFSPFNNRVGLPIMVVACLMARAVRRGAFVLPPKMQFEIWNAGRRRA